jgi:tyrosine-protein phosphatase SIW14
MNARSGMSSLFLVVCGVVCLAGCATRPNVVRAHSWNLPSDSTYAGVPNFGKATTHIWRGGQPTAEGFRQLEAARVKTIVNLRSDHDDFDLLSGTKLKYVRIPMRAWNPGQGDTAQLVLVLKTLRTLSANPATSPVFIHCAGGKDRTGFSVAAYHIVFDHWAPNEAIMQMFDYRFNAIWFANPDFLRRLDAAHVRELVKRAP